MLAVVLLCLVACELGTHELLSNNVIVGVMKPSWLGRFLPYQAEKNHQNLVQLNNKVVAENNLNLGDFSCLAGTFDCPPVP